MATVMILDSKGNLCFRHAVLIVQDGGGKDITLSAEESSHGDFNDTGWSPSPCRICSEEWEKEYELKRDEVDEIDSDEEDK